MDEAYCEFARRPDFPDAISWLARRPATIALRTFSKLHGLAGRQMNRQTPGHTLQPTALVNEALLRLFQAGRQDWHDRAHFYAVAAKAMRRILVDHARGKARLKRQPPGKQVPLEDLVASFAQRSIDIDGLDPALCPGTGTPVPGGLSWREAMTLLRTLGRSGRTIVGFDLCEVGTSDWDANVGARVLYKLAGWAIASQREDA